MKAPTLRPPNPALNINRRQSHTKLAECCGNFRRERPRRQGAEDVAGIRNVARQLVTEPVQLVQVHRVVDADTDIVTIEVRHWVDWATCQRNAAEAVPVALRLSRIRRSIEYGRILAVRIKLPTPNVPRSSVSPDSCVRPNR